MEENVLGKLLPNLTVTVGSESTFESDQIEDGEVLDSFEPPDAHVSLHQSEKTKKSVDIVRSWMESLQDPKVYENKKPGFVTGIDLSHEVLQKKLEDRAERFGLTKNSTDPVTQKDIDNLYLSFDIEPDDPIASSKSKNIRLNTVHMRGVEEMNTHDIFKYFGDYGPNEVEWINDCSCNVVWLDNATTARALLGKSQPFIEKKIVKEDTLELPHVPVKESLPEFNRPTIGSSTSDDSDVDDGRKATGKAIEASMDVDAPSNVVDSDFVSGSPSPGENISVSIPVPPGYWRLGAANPKSRTIILRFATKDDKKLPGAEKRSQYYQKYGNPNYGGMKGLISGSKKRQMQAARNRTVIEKISHGDEPTEIRSSSFMTNRIKMPRMRMYADEEEIKIKSRMKRRNSDSMSMGVHSRLGVKYTRDDLAQLGKRYSSESEGDEDVVSINCTVPSTRFNVWTSIAEEMSRRDRSPSPSEEIIKPKPYRKSNMFSGGHFQSRGSSAFSSLSKRDNTWSKNRKPYRPPRELKSNKHISPLDRDDLPDSCEDLRSKIKKMKTEHSANKHLSPMWKFT